MSEIKKVKKVSVAGRTVWLPDGSQAEFHVGLEVPEGAYALAPAWTGGGYFTLPRGTIVAVGEPYRYSGTTLEVRVS